MAPQPDPDVKAVFNPETGVTSNFFGGDGTPDGDWHGHFDVDEQGALGFTRDPGVKK